MTITEAAQALGYSADTIRRGVVKGTGPLANLLRDAGRKGNEGQWLVSLTDEQIAQHRRASTSAPEPVEPPSIGQHKDVLLERLAGLEQRLADRDAEIDRQAEEISRLRAEMAERNASHRAERAEMQASASAERERLLALLERATVRPGIIERLVAAIRPKTPSS